MICVPWVQRDEYVNTVSVSILLSNSTQVRQDKNSLILMLSDYVYVYMCIDL